MICKKISSTLKSILLSFDISFKASPFIMSIRLFTVVISSIIPFVNALSIKNILNYLTLQDASSVWGWFTVLAITQLFTAVLSKITAYLSVLHNDRISLYLSITVIDKINKLGINYFDNTDLYNEVKNVSSETNSIPNLTWNLLSLIKSIIQFASAYIIISQVSWFSPIIIVASCIPNYLFERLYSLKLYEWNRGSTNEVRKINYIYSTLTEKYFAKDVRTNQIKSKLKEQFISKWKIWFEEKMSINTKQFVSTFCTMFLPHSITLLFTSYIILKSLNGSFQVGDITYYISIMGQLTSSTLAVITQSATTIESKKKIEYYERFLSWEEEHTENEKTRIDEVYDINFDSVFFKYPGNSNYTLHNVSFHINRGEKVAFIGSNGSGKSTIIKLILGFYKPTSGHIYINGIDINQLDLSCLYSLTTVMFQDYINYSFSLRENLMSVDPVNNYHDDSLIEACKKGNSFDFIKLWVNGLDTYLTRSFDMDGQELSSGQWQRLALSRTFVKKASLFIYDEPAASLDIEAENSLYKELILNHQDSMLLLISHRMSYMKNMDKIVVMNNGNIVEQGTHDELLRQNGIYANLYKLKTEGE